MTTTFEIKFNTNGSGWGYDVYDQNGEWMYDEVGFGSYEEAFNWASKQHRWAGDEK